MKRAFLFGLNEKLNFCGGKYKKAALLLSMIIRVLSKLIILINTPEFIILQLKNSLPA